MSKQLLDRCQEIPGCVGGVVPGAGGYDAIAVLVLENQWEILSRKLLKIQIIFIMFTGLIWKSKQKVYLKKNQKTI